MLTSACIKQGKYRSSRHWAVVHCIIRCVCAVRCLCILLLYCNAPFCPNHRNILSAHQKKHEIVIINAERRPWMEINLIRMDMYWSQNKAQHTLCMIYMIYWYQKQVIVYKVSYWSVGYQTVMNMSKTQIILPNLTYILSGEMDYKYTLNYTGWMQVCFITCKWRCATDLTGLDLQQKGVYPLIRFN